MNPGLIRRRTVAVVAAYALALQAVLLAFVPVAPATLATASAVLCTHDGSRNGDAPPRHDLPCAAMCAALGYGVTGTVPHGASIALIAASGFTLVAPARDWVPPSIALRSPHSPRAPPLA